MDDFYTCQRGGPCTREQMQGSQSANIVQRLDDLMRECRNGHQLRYADLVAVRYGTTDPITSPFEFKCRGCGTQYTHAQPCDWCEDGQVVEVQTLIARADANAAEQIAAITKEVVHGRV